jgi:hypothetical protein
LHKLDFVGAFASRHKSFDPVAGLPRTRLSDIGWQLTLFRGMTIFEGMAMILAKLNGVLDEMAIVLSLMSQCDYNVDNIFQYNDESDTKKITTMYKHCVYEDSDFVTMYNLYTEPQGSKYINQRLVSDAETAANNLIGYSRRVKGDTNGSKGLMDCIVEAFKYNTVDASTGQSRYSLATIKAVVKRPFIVTTGTHSKKDYVFGKNVNAFGKAHVTGIQVITNPN